MHHSSRINAPRINAYFSYENNSDNDEGDNDGYDEIEVNNEDYLKILVSK